MADEASQRRRRYLVTGASGRLGGTVVAEIDASGAAVLALSGSIVGNIGATPLTPLPLEDVPALRCAVRDFQPTHVLHLGGITGMAQAFEDPERAHAINAAATAALSQECCSLGARYLFASTDMVFDGTTPPYCEDDPPRPTSVYGQTKVAGERALVGTDAAIARLPLLYGPVVGVRHDEFVAWTAALRRGEPQRLFIDEFRTPISYRDAARAVLAIAGSSFSGIVHVGGPERVSRFELIAAIARRLGIDEPPLVASTRAAVPGPEPRPADLALDSSLYRKHFAECLPLAPAQLEFAGI
ncbi:MAG: sugar nucleotide-binding protein [Planctomycetota bacterium]